MQALDGRHSVGQIERQVLVGLAFVEVDMGIDQAGQQVTSRTLDHRRTLGNDHGIPGPDRLDRAAGYQHGLVFEDRLRVHRHDPNPDQRERIGGFRRLAAPHTGQKQNDRDGDDRQAAVKSHHSLQEAAFTDQERAWGRF